MIFMNFAFQIVLLAFGFGIGYWLLLLANKEQGVLKTVGQALGWVLILVSIFVSLISSYSTIKVANTIYKFEEGFPMYAPKSDKGTPMINQDEESIEDVEEIQDVKQEPKEIQTKAKIK